MSFICAISGKVAYKGTKPAIIITETRAKHYSTTFEKRFGRRKKKITVESDGWEIVREIKVLPAIFKKMLREGSIDDKGILRGSHGGRHQSSQRRSNQFRQTEGRTGRQRSKTNKVSGGKRTSKPFRAQHSKRGSGVSSVHQKSNSQAQDVRLQRGKPKIHGGKPGNVHSKRVEGAAQGKPSGKRRSANSRGPGKGKQNFRNGNGSNTKGVQRSAGSGSKSRTGQRRTAPKAND